MANISDKSFIYAMRVIEDGVYQGIQNIPLIQLKLVASLENDELEMDLSICMN